MKSTSLLPLISIFFFSASVFSQQPKKISDDPAWQKARYGQWGGDGVGATPGSWDTMLLKDYAPVSSIVSQQTFLAKSKYPAIDVHSHTYAQTPQEVADWVTTMDKTGVETTVVLTESIGEDFEKLAAMYVKPYPGRFMLFCGIDMNDMDKPDYSQRAVKELERCYRMGARGVGEMIDKGWGFTGDTTLAKEQCLHPDDARLDAFWDKCAELKIPVSLHVADHPSAWKPLNAYQERTPEYQQYNNYGKNGLSYEALLECRNRTLEKHPNTTFISCHISNQGNDLGALSKIMDRYPNLYIDISARDYEIGRTPRAAKKFITQYSRRVLFGTDLNMYEEMYHGWWRLLESSDEFMTGRIWWRYYGLELDNRVLKAIYNSNAKRILNWEKVVFAE
ncbi:MAG: amidohydrolase family protein [Flavitalea sp.]